MGLYDQALQANAAGQAQALQLRQQALGQPTAIERFMQGLQGGQKRLEASKQAQFIRDQALASKRQKESELARKTADDETDWIKSAGVAISNSPNPLATAQVYGMFKPQHADKLKALAGGFSAPSGQGGAYSLKERGVTSGEGYKTLLGNESEARTGAITDKLQPQIDLLLAQTKESLHDAQRPFNINLNTGIQKPPSGYRYNANGDLEPIPGGPAYSKMEGGASQAKASSDAYSNQMDRLYDIADQTVKMPGLNRVTGLMGAFPDVPGSSAADARAKFETLKSQIAFSVLQDLRSMSKTGGALGQISDKEEAMLQNNLASLQAAQSQEEMVKSIEAIKRFAQDSKARIRSAYETNPSVSATSQQRAPQGQKTGYKEGDVSKSGKYVVRNGKWELR